MNTTIKELVNLQQIDTQIMQIERKLEEIPEEIRSMEERERQLEADFQDASKEMNDLHTVSIEISDMSLQPRAIRFFKNSQQ